MFWLSWCRAGRAIRRRHCRLREVWELCLERHVLLGDIGSERYVSLACGLNSRYHLDRRAVCCHCLVAWCLALCHRVISTLAGARAYLVDGARWHCWGFRILWWISGICPDSGSRDAAPCHRRVVLCELQVMVIGVH